MTDREGYDEASAARPSGAPGRPAQGRERTGARASGSPPIIIPVRSSGTSSPRWYASTRTRLLLAALVLLVGAGVVAALRGTRPAAPVTRDSAIAAVVNPSASPGPPPPRRVGLDQPPGMGAMPRVASAPAAAPVAPATATPAAVPPAPVETTAAPTPAARSAVRGAATAAEARAGVAGALGAYAAAIGSRDADGIALVYPSISDADRDAWRGFFQAVGEITARLAARDVRVVGPDRAEALVSGTYAYTTGTPARRVRKAVAFTGSFVRDAAGAWRLDAVR